jgi:electron transfer flavoprotein beta subunit
MKIVVAVKQVATPDEDFDLSDDERSIEEDALEWDLNEWDTFAMEAALELRDDAGEGEVVAVTVGNDEAREGLLTVLAMGADRAVHLRSDELLDPLAIARLLAPVVREEAPDLVLCGVQSSDAVNGATGVALAGLLKLPRVAVVKKIDVDGGSATVERELEGGLVERLRVALPALLTVQTGINEPRYATLRGIRQASAKPMDVREAPEVEAGSRLVSLSAPPKGEGADMLDGGAGEIARRIAAIIKSKVAS